MHSGLRCRAKVASSGEPGCSPCTVTGRNSRVNGGGGKEGGEEGRKTEDGRKGEEREEKKRGREEQDPFWGQALALDCQVGRRPGLGGKLPEEGQAP